MEGEGPSIFLMLSSDSSIEISLVLKWNGLGLRLDGPGSIFGSVLTKREFLAIVQGSCYRLARAQWKCYYAQSSSLKQIIVRLRLGLDALDLNRLKARKLLVVQSSTQDGSDDLGRK